MDQSGFPAAKDINQFWLSKQKSLKGDGQTQENLWEVGGTGMELGFWERCSLATRGRGPVRSRPLLTFTPTNTKSNCCQCHCPPRPLPRYEFNLAGTSTRKCQMPLPANWFPSRIFPSSSYSLPRKVLCRCAEC